RGTPEKGDAILLVGGRTGRDGIGGATGSSKDHTEKALENSAEVQKGDAPMERKLQRLFRNPEASVIIKRCNDFGAGGVSVAIGELAPSLEINLDAVPKKYEGLDGTELAISESQERMAVVVSPENAEKFARFAAEENLECTLVARVTDSGRLVMMWNGAKIVDLQRKFLDTNGTTAVARASVSAPSEKKTPFAPSGKDAGDAEAWKAALSSLNCCSQRGLIERFDSTIGAGSVLHPFGGKNLETQPDAMCSKIPLLKGETNTGTLFSFGFNPNISKWSPFHGAQFAVLESVAKIASSGGDVSRIRFTFQEYFEKLRGDPKRWGKPLAAVLGALEAQMRTGCASIGGKDSMSGSFNDIDVPPTLVSFAMCPCDVRGAVSPEFKKAGSSVVLLEAGADDSLEPNWEAALKKYGALFEAVKRGDVLAAKVVRFGGVAEAVAKMAFGNSIGFEFDKDFKGDVFALNCGAIVVELAEGASLEGSVKLGKTIPEAEIRAGSGAMGLDDLREAWRKPLEGVFPTLAEPSQSGAILKPSFARKEVFLSPNKFAKPRVFIPVFPGTNCEYDTARAFERAGAVAKTFVFRNMSDADVAFSI
ncbi:MAG: phosphoribosylformylglycinamidine synthase subunit PurQ, partial [Opitutales bacterium]|nr:phosphoribosylformylglycinamidine synthase subunit PurQ [Opitutales bacterium]